jgi:glutamate synthase (NADPH/NADH) large chain
MFDNTLELLVLAGRPLPHAMMMMIPEPWSNHESMDPQRRAFYQYHSCLMEPWDGPAAMRFTDGTRSAPCSTATACVRRVTTSPRTASSSWPPRPACWTIPPEDIVQKGRLQPGRMFLVDTVQGRIIEDEEIKRRSQRAALPRVAQRAPRPPQRPARRARPSRRPTTPRCSSADRLRLHHEDERIIIAPMAGRRRGHRLHGQRRRARGALQQAAPALRLLQAALRPGHQPADRLIREEIVTSPRPGSAPRATCSTRSPTACRRVELKWPVLTNEEFAKIRRTNLPGLRSACCRSSSASPAARRAWPSRWRSSA